MLSAQKGRRKGRGKGRESPLSFLFRRKGEEEEKKRGKCSLFSRGRRRRRRGGERTISALPSIPLPFAAAANDEVRRRGKAEEEEAPKSSPPSPGCWKPKSPPLPSRNSSCHSFGWARRGKLSPLFPSSPPLLLPPFAMLKSDPALGLL